MLYELEGPWDIGYAFDLHTVDSTYVGVDSYGHDQWDTKRSEMGQLVYELKYRGQTEAIAKIVDLLLEHFRGIEKKDWIIPIPPTKQRSVQPVIEIARELGRRTGVLVVDNLLVKEAGLELKSVDNVDEREQLLQQSLKISSSHDLKGKNVLLLDDLYRSGATLTAATRLLYDNGAKSVAVLTMTKTRSKR